MPIFRQFLREHCAAGCGSLSSLTATAINKFVERHVNDRGPRSAQIMCSVLRSFLRYLKYRGEIACDLASAVPTVRRWKLTSLPKSLDPRDIRRVLATCDRHTALGRRDYAILVVLARMGLRANEVRFLTLDDIDWESGPADGSRQRPSRRFNAVTQRSWCCGRRLSAPRTAPIG